MDENILSKIIEVLINSEIELNTEGVYEGYVMRDYYWMARIINFVNIACILDFRIQD